MMRQTWRWFGPDDLVGLDVARQAGAEGIVTALDEIPSGEVWEVPQIERRQREVRDGGMEWEVVESLPVSEETKLQSGPWREHAASYVHSLENLAACGIKVVCYNFMPVLDWTRTDLKWRLDHGGTAMRFDLADFALFDIHVLNRERAADDYPSETAEEANRRASERDGSELERLAGNILVGLPGSSESWTVDRLRKQLELYRGMGEEDLRSNLVSWLEVVAPEAERLGMLLCCHPDDPPFPLLGLPRVMSTEKDFERVTSAVPVRANGITFCSGSLGARADNDLPGFVGRLGSLIHFAHLRNVTREGDGVPCGFFEDGHLSGMTDMVAVVRALLTEQERRRGDGREDWHIPMRPDHGQDLASDLGSESRPGYPAVGRLRGLAELRGVMSAIGHG